MTLSNKKLSSNNLQEKKPSNSNYSSQCDQIATSTNEVRVSRNSRKKFPGVTKRSSGKYGVKIHDRLRKKDLWLGTFDSAEEGSKVYLDKKKELEEELRGCTRSIIKDAKRTSKFVGVSLRDSGKFAAHIRDPIRKKKIYLGAFESEEEASEVYLAKKAELEEEVKGKGIRWMAKRKCRGKSMRCEIKKNVDKLGRCIEENNSDRSLDSPAMDIDDSERDSIDDGPRVCEEKSPIHQSLEDNDESSRQSDNSDSCDGESVSKNAVTDEKLSASQENNDNRNTADQDSSIEVHNSDSPHEESALTEARVLEENAPIQKNGEPPEEELVFVDLNALSQVNTGVQILLRTKSGTPLLDSNGFLLGKWSWIDDLSLPIDM